MEIKRTFSRIIYHIEPKPGGGFVATCKDPTQPQLEAPTRMELQQKIQAQVNTELATQFPGLKLPLQSTESKTAWHIEAKPGGGFTAHPSDPSMQPIEGNTKEEVEAWMLEKLISHVQKTMPSELAAEFTNQLNSSGLDAFVTSKVSVTGHAGSHSFTFGGGQNPASLSSDRATNAGPITPQSLSQDSSPITPVSSGIGNFVRFLLAALIIFGLLYIFMHRGK